MTERGMPRFSGEIEPPAPDAVRIAFLNHFVLPERELAFIEPSLGRLHGAARRALFHRLTGLMDLEPSVLFARNLFGGRVWFASILLPASAADFEELHRSGVKDLAVRRIQEALEMGRNLGCTVGGLGAYTSIVTDDGLMLQPPAGMKLSTGNAFTAAVGVHRVLRLCRRRGIDPRAPDSRLGILGASGNIGTGLAHRMAKGDTPFRDIVLVGRRVERLQALADSIRQFTAGLCHVETSTSLSALESCNVIAAATGTNEPLLYPRHLSAARPVILADLSVPGVVAAAVRQMRNVHIVSLAGRVPVPGTPDFAMASHIPAGTAFSCAGESMLLALAPSETRDLTLVGPLRERSVDVLEALAVEVRTARAHETHWRNARRRHEGPLQLRALAGGRADRGRRPGLAGRARPLHRERRRHGLVAARARRRRGRRRRHRGRPAASRPSEARGGARPRTGRGGPLSRVSSGERPRNGSVG